MSFCASDYSSEKCTEEQKQKIFSNFFSNYGILLESNFEKIIRYLENNSLKKPEIISKQFYFKVDERENMDHSYLDDSFSKGNIDSLYSKLQKNIIVIQILLFVILN